MPNRRIATRSASSGCVNPAPFRKCEQPATALTPERTRTCPAPDGAPNRQALSSRQTGFKQAVTGKT
jgi:hypothetical protein